MMVEKKPEKKIDARVFGAKWGSREMSAETRAKDINASHERLRELYPVASRFVDATYPLIESNQVGRVVSAGHDGDRVFHIRELALIYYAQVVESRLPQKQENHIGEAPLPVREAIKDMGYVQALELAEKRTISTNIQEPLEQTPVKNRGIKNVSPEAQIDFVLPDQPMTWSSEDDNRPAPPNCHGEGPAPRRPDDLGEKGIKEKGKDAVSKAKDGITSKLSNFFRRNHDL